MTRVRGSPAGAGFVRAALAIALALPLSCSDLPTKPLRLVTVSGGIRDRDGRAVTYLVLRFSAPDRTGPERWWDEEGEHWGWIATTDDSGAYSLELPEGVYAVSLEPTYFGSGGWYFKMRGIRVGPARTRFDYRFGGVRLTGVVLGPDSLPAYGEITASGDGAYFRQWLQDGRYAFVMPPRRYFFSVRVYPPGAGSITRYTTPVDVLADTTLDFHLPGYAITGRVVDGRTSEPIAQATLTFQSPSGNSQVTLDWDGRYTAFVPEGGCEATFQPDYSMRHIASRRLGSLWISGPATLDWTILSVVWSGTLKDRASGSPVAGGGVSAYAGSRGSSASVTTDAQGGFRLEVLPGMGYDVGAYASNPTRRAELRGVVSAADTTFDLELEPGTSPLHPPPPPVPVSP